jgi:hypothetical protein
MYWQSRCIVCLSALIVHQATPPQLCSWISWYCTCHQGAQLFINQLLTSKRSSASGFGLDEACARHGHGSQRAMGLEDSPFVGTNVLVNVCPGRICLERRRLLKSDKIQTNDCYSSSITKGFNEASGRWFSPGRWRTSGVLQLTLNGVRGDLGELFLFNLLFLRRVHCGFGF